MNYFDRIEHLIGLIEGLPQDSKKTAAVGFDAAVDTILRPVRRVDENGKPEFFKTIGEFGEHVSQAAGLSCAVDVRRISRQLGGNMPNLSRCIAGLGVHVSCIGNMGLPEANELFKSFDADLYSVGEAGSCSALQFDDGKVMLSNMQGAEELDYNAVESCLGAQKLNQIFAESDMVGFVNWAEMRCATDIWRGVLREVWSQNPPDFSKLLLVDLTDCSKKSAEQLGEAVDVINQCSKYRRVVWSLNQREAGQLGACLGYDLLAPEKLAITLLNGLNADLLFIHGQDFCIAAENGESINVPGFYIGEPKISVGGGDNFNAGLAFALMNGFDREYAAMFAVALAACYVRDGVSPSIETVKKLVTQQAAV